jgi:hypothetical protein
VREEKSGIGGWSMRLQRGSLPGPWGVWMSMREVRVGRERMRGQAGWRMSTSDQWCAFAMLTTSSERAAS